MKPFVDEQSIYLIAEIGGNHEGSFKSAQEQCRLAIESGADCIKFQLYTADGLVNPNLSHDRHSHFRRFELSREQHIKLAEMCLAAGCDYLASVWESEMIEWIDPYLTHYKIGSGDLTAIPMLREFAKRGKPIILSTGLSTLVEVRRAVSEIRKTNTAYEAPGMITLLQCTSMYPISDGDANLSVIPTLAEIPGVRVGYSDHTVGMEALVLSVALGARVLEFHFTDLREGRDFRDHKVSLMVNEVKELRQRCEKVLTFLGSPDKRPLDIEITSGHVTTFRRALFPARDLASGTIVTKEDLLCLRPCSGIGAEHYDKVLGLKLLQPVRRLQKLDWFMFDKIQEIK
jgi:N-acetylneuraminate synthase/N,N'-diacetyllegionaminate synthase